ncbi:HET domain-containing [Fusarium albosuccineum]|uniref:HET domain-containing n=1 Tax=Fusarium albosuccineum TaxID=1237068 RepID=A0A8H4LBM9_9HYPO|nr:HET domain-containing [Fusarium albosuccineum]
MRLLNTTTLKLTMFLDGKIPPYTILSHTWGSEEVLFQDLGNNPSAKAGWRKVQSACELARTLGKEWIWIDTCCIDKSNHDELTESINSMFRWYKEATICYAYMADVPYSTSEPADYMTYLGGSRWFTRGWTLQELLAPQFVDFYSAEWKLIGSKDKLGPHLERITGIGAAYMDYRKHIHKSLTAASVAERMSWASKRQTTRIEDLAYCLLGIFNINMPLIYGEREKAFLRLQQAILQEIDDQTILAWGTGFVGQDRYDNPLGEPQSLFAKNPSAFKDCGDLVPWNNPRIRTRLNISHEDIIITSPIFWDNNVRDEDPFNPRSKYSTVVLVAPLRCRRRNDFFNCIALILNSNPFDTPATGTEFQLSKLRYFRVMTGWYLIPRISWRREVLRSVVIQFEPPPRVTYQGADEEEGCLIRTLPKGYAVTEIYSANVGYQEMQPLLHIPPRQPYAMTLPIIVGLEGPSLPRLALILRYRYSVIDTSPDVYMEDFEREQRSPEHDYQYDLHYMYNRLVLLPDDCELEQIAEIDEAEIGEIWDFAMEADSEPVEIPSVWLDERQSQLTTYEAFSLRYAQDDVYGDNMFLIDLEDPNGVNVSEEDRYKLEDCGLKPWIDAGV